MDSASPPTVRAARSEEQWDAFVHQNGGCFLQSWGWSRFQEAAGRTVYRFRIDRPATAGQESEDTVVQFMLVIHDLPMNFRYAYVPRGPIIASDGGSREASERLETFIAAMHDAMERKGYIFGRVDFPWLAEGGPIDELTLRKHLLNRVGDVQPVDTSIIDLEPSEEDLLAAMHQKTRYNIRLAERKHGVTVRKACRDNAHLFRHDVDVFWRLLEETSSRDNFHTHPRSYYEKMLDALSPKKRVGMSCRLHFAEWQGKAVAAAITAEYGDTVTYLHGASLSEFRKTMAPHALHWQLIRQAKADGFAKYDFWGVAPDDAPANHRWAGITRFKKGFGGRTESYLGAWELPQSLFWYSIYRHARRFRNV